MTATTLKVSRELRDRIARLAAARGVSAGELLSRLIDEQDRQARLAAVRQAYAVPDASYAAETAAWDAVAADGLP
jgi:predicted transcriptional regulator